MKTINTKTATAQELNDWYYEEVGYRPQEDDSTMADQELRDLVQSFLDETEKEITSEEPKIVLKKVKTFRGREGYGLNAEVYLNGHKVCFFMDAADGGEPRYEIIDEVRFDAFKKYAANLPKRLVTTVGEPWHLEVKIDQLIDDVYNTMQKEKAFAKMKKKFSFAIIFGKLTGNAYTEVKFKKPLSEIPTDKLQATVDKYKAMFEEGDVFFNDNFKALKIKA